MDEYEWGVMTRPPLIFAYQFSAMPDEDMARYMAGDGTGFWHVVRRPVGKAEFCG